MKSIGNSTTAPRDLVSEDDVKITLMALCESVGARLREQNCLCSTVALGIRDNRLLSYDRQTKLNRPTANTLDIWETAVELFRRHHTGREPVRSLSVKASGLTPADSVVQLSRSRRSKKSPAPGRHRPDAGQNPGQVRVSQHSPGHCACRPSSGSGRQRGAYHPSHRLSGDTP